MPNVIATVLSLLAISAPVLAVDYTKANSPQELLEQFHADLKRESYYNWKMVPGGVDLETWFSHRPHTSLDRNTPTLHQRWIKVKLFHKDTGRITIGVFMIGCETNTSYDTNGQGEQLSPVIPINPAPDYPLQVMRQSACREE